MNSAEMNFFPQVLANVLTDFVVGFSSLSACVCVCVVGIVYSRVMLSVCMRACVSADQTDERAVTRASRTEDPPQTHTKCVDDILREMWANKASNLLPFLSNSCPSYFFK